MTRRLPTSCIDCGAPSSGTRCPTHERRRKRIRNADRPIARQVVADHLATHGPVCPGWGRDPHDVNPADLTADHVLALANGGTNDGPRRALCRSCNAAKGTR